MVSHSLVYLLIIVAINVCVFIPHFTSFCLTYRSDFSPTDPLSQNHGRRGRRGGGGGGGGGGVDGQGREARHVVISGGESIF